MISRQGSSVKLSGPAFEIEPLRTESDVEQKLLYPFLTHSSYLNLPADWIRTKDYMTPTEIDKVAGKRFGYFPDYSVWIGGLPLLIVEAKMPDVAIEYAMREARLYAIEINKRYAPNVNPVAFILACNGVEFSLSPWDSEETLLKVLCSDARPGTKTLQTIQGSIGKMALEALAKRLSAHFQPQQFFRVSAFMGGQSRVSQQLGVNEFAEPLFPSLTKYFGAASDEVPDEVIDRAYVTSDELGSYEAVLETYLKDRSSHIAGNQLVPVSTSKNQATGISTEFQRFASNPTQYSRVQLIVGAVGAGKSSFIRRYYNHLMSSEVRDRTRWSF